LHAPLPAAAGYICTLHADAASQNKTKQNNEQNKTKQHNSSKKKRHPTYAQSMITREIRDQAGQSAAILVVWGCIVPVPP
jgi:hypothetical protein